MPQGFPPAAARLSGQSSTILRSRSGCYPSNISCLCNSLVFSRVGHHPEAPAAVRGKVVVEVCLLTSRCTGSFSTRGKSDGNSRKYLAHSEYSPSEWAGVCHPFCWPQFYRSSTFLVLQLRVHYCSASLVAWKRKIWSNLRGDLYKERCLCRSESLPSVPRGTGSIRLG